MQNLQFSYFLFFLRFDVKFKNSPIETMRKVSKCRSKCMTVIGIMNYNNLGKLLDLY